jgi:hypothetical protein
VIYELILQYMWDAKDEVEKLYISENEEDIKD